MFDAQGDSADRADFASRCEDDRHHFRFIVSPEDAGEIGDLRRFTRDLMADMAKDLETRLDWIAVDHWNTDNPHIHIRSEEHTSELQSLMRISYAVFCLKKKKYITNISNKLKRDTNNT